MAIDKINATALLDGGVDTADIADDAISTDKLANSSVTTAKLNNSSVSTDKIIDGNVTSAKLDTNIDVTGNLTVDTDTLYVNATTNEVMINGPSDSGLASLIVGSDGSSNGIAIYETANLGSSFRMWRDENIAYLTRGGTTNGLAINADGSLYSDVGIRIGDNVDAHQMDIYEEGSWTPTHSTTFTQGAWDSSTGFVIDSARYQRVGNTVTCHAVFTVVGNSASIATSANIAFTGLPYAPLTTGSTLDLGSGTFLIYTSMGSGEFASGVVNLYGSSGVEAVMTVTAVAGSVTANSPVAMTISYTVA